MIYFIQRPSDGHIKIGFTDNPHSRFSALRRQHGKDIVLLGLIEGDFHAEQSMHARFGEYRVDPVAEWFTPGQEILDFVDSNTHLEIPKDKSVRLLIDLPDELDNLLKTEAQRLDTPIASIVRHALIEHYHRQGRLLDTRINNWGRYRSR